MRLVKRNRPRFQDLILVPVSLPSWLFKKPLGLTGLGLSEDTNLWPFHTPRELPSCPRDIQLPRRIRGERA
ncbi:UNVERIFIED_CONTAM: hypothetical protein GTU68_067071 [Idotea baltica]|nr:hypothetical protein [Idotea baltica]